MQPTDPNWVNAERQRAAATRSYTTPAVITLVLYFVLWIPGLIANLVYWNSARQAEMLTGQAPEGKGCLTALLWVFIIIPLIGIALFVVFGLLVTAHH